MQLNGRNVLVVGMAKSGLACVEFLQARGAHVTAMDQRPLSALGETAAALERLGTPFLLQGAATINGFDLIVLSPGVPPDSEPLEAQRAKGVAVIGEVELAGRFLLGDTIGITGSNGKTTVTSLVGHILKSAGIPAQVGGNIGTPATAMVASSRCGQWNVLELSSFQLETIVQFRARIGVGLNVTPDHLDRHKTFERYAAAKARLFETQQAGDFAVLNAADATCRGYAALSEAAKFWFNAAAPDACGAFADDAFVWLREERLMRLREIPLRGRHNVENVMAAALAASLAGASHEAIAAAVATFPGVEHRLELVRVLGGVAYYNDSKATNVDATLKALDAFDERLWVILGGKDKGSDYRPLAAPLARKAAGVLLIGAAAPLIAAQLEGAAPLVECGDLARAVRYAAAQAQAGDIVLLAPACASFDQFENFEHRGRVFKQLVSSLDGGAEQERE